MSPEQMISFIEKHAMLARGYANGDRSLVNTIPSPSDPIAIATLDALMSIAHAGAALATKAEMDTLS